MKNFIKCTNSFLIGFYLAFVLTLSTTGWIITNSFISKSVLNKSFIYIDGKVYEIKRK
jgi:hypothetical protein